MEKGFNILKYKMEIEKEAQARVDFKMNELLTAIKNTANHNWNNAFNSGHPKYQYYWEAFSQMSGMFKKELEMGLPFNEMSERNRTKKRDKAIEEIMGRICDRGKTHPLERINKERELVAIIEECQKW